MIALKGKSLGLSVAQARLAGISHPDRGHDDVANAVAGAAALSKFGGYDTSMRWVSGDDDDDAAWRRVCLQAFINSGGDDGVLRAHSRWERQAYRANSSDKTDGEVARLILTVGRPS